MGARHIRCCLVVLALAGLSACGEAPAGTQAVTAPNREACTPSDEALRNVGKLGENAAILKDGDRIAPHGDIAVGDGVFGFAVAVDPAGDRAYMSGPRGVVVTFDLALKRQLQSIGEPTASSLFARREGDVTRVYVAGGSGQDVVIFKRTDGGLERERQIPLGGYVQFVAPDPADAGYVYAGDTTRGDLVRIPLAGGEPTRIDTGDTPVKIAFNADGTRIAVANWAGDSIALIDPAGRTARKVKTGKGTAGVAFSRDGARVFAVNTDAATISVVDWASGEVRSNTPVNPAAPELGGWSPTTAVADGDTLYIALSARNAVAVYDVSGAAPVRTGLIPTGEYPVDLALDRSGGAPRLFVACAGGMGGAPNGPDLFSSGNAMKGGVNWFAVPQAAELGALTAIADDNDARAKRFFPAEACGDTLIPAAGPDPIEHVVFIMKENKTYDEVLGDLKKDGVPWGNGDPSLCLFPEKNTPNYHALARRFAVFDNFYCESEVSLQGHLWSVYGEANDFLNRVRFDQLALAGWDPATRPGTPSIFDQLTKFKVPWRSYGQMVGLGPEILTGVYLGSTNPKYPWYNQNVKDVLKAQEIIREIDNGIFRPFTYISLPNDHTFGADPGKPTPQAAVADNDHALGLIVERISRSPYWAKTAIFVFQDDPQSAIGDHVDSHRSPALIISPWTKRGYMSHVHYSMASFIKSALKLLNVPEINQNVSDASLTYDVWSATPDTEPYTALKPDIPDELNPEETPAAAKQAAAAYDFRYPDGKRGLGDIIYDVMRPGVPRPAHAKRLDE